MFQNCAASNFHSMNFALVISFILMAMIGTIVSPNPNILMHPTELAKLNLAQAKSALQEAGITLDIKALETLFLHHDARDNKALAYVSSFIKKKIYKAASLLKQLSKNPTFDVKRAIKASIDANDQKLLLLLIYTNPDTMKYGLQYAISASNMEIVKELVRRLGAKYDQSLIIDAIEFSRQSGNIQSMEFLKNYMLLDKRQLQIKQTLDRVATEKLDLSKLSPRLKQKLNLNVKDLNFAFETRRYGYAKDLLTTFRIRPDQTTMHAVIDEGSAKAFQKLLEYGVKPDQKAIQMLVKKKDQSEAKAFEDVIRSNYQTLEPNLVSILDDAAENGDLDVIKLLVEDIGVKPTEGTIGLGTLGNTKTYNYLMGAYFGKDTQAILPESVDDLILTN
jgi:hypothetical protein